MVGESRHKWYKSILMTIKDKRDDGDVKADCLMVSGVRVTAIVMEHQGVARRRWKKMFFLFSLWCLTLGHHQLDRVGLGDVGDAGVLGRVGERQAGDEELAVAGLGHLLALQRDPGPVLGSEDLAVPGPVEGGGRGGEVGDGAVESDGAPLGHVLGPRSLYPRLHLPPLLRDGRVLHDHQAEVLHLQPHAVADLGQSVDTALVPPGVPELGLVDDQGPVPGVDLRPEHEVSQLTLLNTLSAVCILVGKVESFSGLQLSEWTAKILSRERLMRIVYTQWWYYAKIRKI